MLLAADLHTSQTILFHVALSFGQGSLIRKGRTGYRQILERSALDDMLHIQSFSWDGRNVFCSLPPSEKRSAQQKK